MQTAPCYVPSFLHNTGVWQTDGRTDGQTDRQTGIAVASTALAMLALRRAVKLFALCYIRLLSVLSVTLVYCGQTVGWIKMKLCMLVGLSPGHVVLDLSLIHI